MNVKKTSRATLALAVIVGAASVMACGDGSGSDASATTGSDDDPSGSGSSGTEQDLPEGVFESGNPSGPSVSSEAGRTSVDANGGGIATTGSAGEATSASGTGVAPPQAPDPTLTDEADSDDNSGEQAATRAIEEADIIKISGDRLYALSAYGGLSVVDISDPDALSLLGRHRTTATPFEMYVRGESVFVLYNGYGEYTYDDDADTWTYYQTSYVIALDASDPANIAEAEKFEIEGYINDSRLVGDVMYVVAFDDANCYRCGNSAETNVMSIDVSDANDIEKVEELTFPERLNEFSWRRSLSATNERLYIAGPRYGNGTEPEGSVIQVVDIGDASGDMTEGDSLEVAGQINSRWQMDEYDGVLRVISQPLSWRADSVPVVETFSIESSAELTPLGSTDLVLPRPEELQSVRFDGTRAYAITFERTDPLFTIDLSEPETPLQMGELEMPGWVYHMEPRGDRVIGLGFDQGNAEGSLTVSIFDVSNLREPTMIERVNFGGDWAELAEDQDRIHKSFQVLDDHELILVPFSGYDYSNQEDECSGRSSYVSGVQLIDWADDSLALRGVAPSRGQARRAFFVEDRLLAMSDERLESFDVSDRDEPSSTSMLELAQIVNRVATVGDTVVRVGDDWWSDTMEATVSSLSELTSYEPGVKVQLPQINRYTCDSESWFSNMMSGGDHAYFFYNHYDWSNQRDQKEELRILTLDVSDPDAPEIAGDAALDFFPNYGRSYVPGMVDNGSASVAVGDSLVFAQHDVQYNNLGFVTQSGYTLETVDFSDPSDPRRSTTQLPDSLGSTGLVVSGDVVASSHFETSPVNPDNVRFYLDRLDVSDPGDPVLLDSVNIPGSLLAYDHETSRALTVDYQWVRLENISPKQCYEEEFGQFLTPDPSLVDFDTGMGPCEALRFSLQLIEIEDGTASVVDTYEVDKGVTITAAAIGDDRVFLGTGSNNSGYYGGYGYDEPPSAGVSMVSPGGIVGGARISYAYYTFQTSEAKLLVASGMSDGELQVASATLETTDNFYGFDGLVAKGTQAVVATGWNGTLSVIDASDASDPVVRQSAELAGNLRDLDLAGDVAIAALGQAGVQTMELE